MSKNDLTNRLIRLQVDDTMILSSIKLILITFTMTHLFLKRNLSAAIGVHFLMDYLFFIVVNNSFYMK